jgi:hypothetical protein
VGKEATEYTVSPIPADFGQGFEVRKPLDKGGEVYCVNLGADAAHSSCECKGFLRWAHCKHVAGLIALREQGRL